MAVLNFPADTSQSPYEENGITYVWDGQAWVSDGGESNFLPTSGGNITGDLTVDGDATVGSLNGGPLAGFRNRIINSLGSAGTVVNQRGYVSGSTTTSANQYTIDRWKVVVSGESLQWDLSDTNGIRAFTAPAGGVEQVIEGINVPAGTYTLNWKGSASATVRIGNGAVNAITKGSQVVISNDNAGSDITIRLSSGTFYAVQFEPGLVATPIEFRPYTIELLMCYRYYQHLTVRGLFTNAHTNGVVAASFIVPNAGRMRTGSPTTQANIGVSYNDAGGPGKETSVAVIGLIADHTNFEIQVDRFNSQDFAPLTMTTQNLRFEDEL